MTKSIPERWLNYEPYGDVIVGTKLLAFKVPLKETVVNDLQPDKQFTTSILMKSQPKLKYVIDLTNTTKYYNPSDFTSVGIKYMKIMLPGGQVPPQECVKRFFKIIEQFSEESGPDDIIGVHCTHGVNRTGYLICRYLIQQLGWDHDKAFQGFKEARGYMIERTVYINKLINLPVGSKLDIRKVKLNVPLKLGKQKKYVQKHYTSPRSFLPTSRQSSISLLRSFPNDRLPRTSYFYRNRPLPPTIRAPPLLRRPIYRPLVPPRGAFGPLPSPSSMRHGPPLPLLHGPAGVCMPVRPRLTPVMGPPGPPPRVSGISLRLSQRLGPPTHRPGPSMPPPPGPPMRMQPKSMKSAKRVKDQDFTADVFEENLTAKPLKNYPKH
ncbi:PREDICTED: RNA/RNP complex-1-interacting phosphatase [Ceratosolen solmsi marchali]|uniref:RNA/RNP complex-1-interacting phosphatase n=1 Tax=Ceratosolen solmsi marchali TaxID=326594 RepID=A0AAJ6YJ01_9HYME|nr:PREDICTED: RNA/RNP complex-1-interacting phosphatase [Ceratosolen solmsi marchali]